MLLRNVSNSTLTDLAAAHGNKADSLSFLRHNKYTNEGRKTCIQI